MQYDLNNVQGGKFPPSVVQQRIPDAEEKPAARARSGNFMFLSAYALSLRDPGLFAACYTVNPKPVLS